MRRVARKPALSAPLESSPAPFGGADIDGTEFPESMCCVVCVCVCVCERARARACLHVCLCRQARHCLPVPSVHPSLPLNPSRPTSGPYSPSHTRQNQALMPAPALASMATRSFSFTLPIPTSGAPPHWPPSQFGALTDLAK